MVVNKKVFKKIKVLRIHKSNKQNLKYLLQDLQGQNAIDTSVLSIRNIMGVVIYLTNSQLLLYIVIYRL